MKLEFDLEVDSANMGRSGKELIELLTDVLKNEDGLYDFLDHIALHASFARSRIGRETGRETIDETDKTPWPEAPVKQMTPSTKATKATKALPKNQVALCKRLLKMSPEEYREYCDSRRKDNQ